MGRFTHLNPSLIPLCEGIDAPRDRMPRYVTEEKCPCGCKDYIKGTIRMIKNIHSPKGVWMCSDCKRVRLEIREDYAEREKETED